jgi:hypothetical protein
LRGRAGIVDHNAIAFDADGTVDDDRLVESVVLEARMVRAVRYGAYRLAHGRFRSAPDFFAQRPQVDVPQERLQTLLEHRARSNLSPDVAERHLRNAHVLGNQVEQRLIALSSFH